MKLLLDEMLPTVTAKQLRGRSHDVIAVGERPELRGFPDPDLFEHVQQEQRAIVTYNREDFLALDRQYRSQGRSHHCVVILNSRRFPQGAGTIGSLIRSLEARITAGAPYGGFVHWLQQNPPTRRL